MIPVVDCSEGILNERDHIFDALSKTGFVFLVNHGIEEKLIDEAFDLSGKFFSYPIEEKQKYARSNEEKTKNSGYIGIGIETLNKEKKSLELREAFNVCPTDGSNVNFPTSKLPHIDHVIRELMENLHMKAMEVLEILAEKLKIDKKWLITQHIIDRRPNYTTLRLLYYPSVPDQIPTGAERCGDHADYGTITLLFQDEVGGLEVMARSGEYIFIKPIKYAILLNTGELLEKWSGGIIRATRHRVRAPADPQLRQKIRQSIAYFVHPVHETIVEPLAGEKEKYETVHAGEFVDQMFAKTY